MAVSAAELARDLEELIAALDRRLPGVAQAGEIGIARDAAVLRAHAVTRLEALNQSSDTSVTQLDEVAVHAFKRSLPL